MFCTRCGAKNPDDSKFCTACGAPLRQPTPAAPAAEPAPMGAAGESADRVVPQTVALDDRAAEPGEKTTLIGDVAAASAAPAAGPAMTAPMPRVSATGPGSTAPSSTKLPPSIPQDDILFQQPRKKRGVSIAIVAVVCVVVAVLAGAGVWVGMGLLSGTDASTPDPAGEQAASGDAVSLDLEISSLDIASYPEVTLDISVDGAEADALSGLAADDFSIEENTPDGGSQEVAADSIAVDDDGEHVRLVYTSDLGSGITRTTKISLADGSGFTGSASANFTAPTDDASDDDATEADDDSGAASKGDYMLPDSASRRYSTSELEKLSDWELYIARNEIYARHGRRFQNQDLQSYFNGKDWYTPRYSPEEFDANVTLSDTELANAEAIRSIEQSRGSEYL